MKKGFLYVEKHLDELLQHLPFKVEYQEIKKIKITGIAIDSRSVKKGNLFIAMKGEFADGHAYIKDAIVHGAAAVVGEIAINDLSVPYIRVKNTRTACTWLAASFYDNPGKKLTVIGITGTDGKTTTCNLLYQILLAAGYRTGMITTVNAVIGEEIIDTGFHVTTPDAPEIQEYLARMVDAGMTHAILETTSHGLAQHRADGAFYDIGVITNITHEHLDQHGSFENYRNAKGRLFQLLGQTPKKKNGNPRLAVLNYDDPSFEYLSSLSDGPQISYGINQKADIFASNVKYLSKETVFIVNGPNFKFQVKSHLAGEFNIYNCLAAIGAAATGLGVGMKAMAKGIEAMQGIPGRMERIDLGQPFTAIVDFAHTPNAMRVAINTLKNITHNKIILIYGSAGLRDKDKRKLMSQISTQFADISIFTAEDPRTESLSQILKEMAIGAVSVGGIEGKTFYRIDDRGEAIRSAVKMAQPGDIVVACGKGHEQSMAFGTEEYPWDDRVAMRAAISELLHIPGPKMPYLPTQRHSGNIISDS